MAQLYHQLFVELIGPFTDNQSASNVVSYVTVI